MDFCHREENLWCRSTTHWQNSGATLPAKIKGSEVVDSYKVVGGNSEGVTPASPTPRKRTGSGFNEKLSGNIDEEVTL